MNDRIESVSGETHMFVNVGATNFAPKPFHDEIADLSSESLTKMFDNNAFAQEIDDKKIENMFDLMNELAYRQRLTRTSFWSAYRYHLLNDSKKTKVAITENQ